MSSRRERMEIVVHGGRPWGFSIKGGQESNKPLVISKLEMRGKAERSGLFVGDVVYSINNVLTAKRNEAIQLVKSSGQTLTVEIERGMLATGPHGVNHSAPRSAPYHSNDFYIPALQDQEQQYDYNHGEVNQRSPNYEHPLSKSDDVFHQRPVVRSSHDDLRASSTSLNEDFLTPQGDAAHKDLYSSPPSRSTTDVRSQNKKLVPSNIAGDSVPQPVVKLRTRKARDKGTSIERPRSWHASKHPDLEIGYLSEERSMRSPGSGYLGSPTTQSTSYYQQPLGQRRPRSKGWLESGELKSVYRGDVEGSKDSLISGDSHRSRKSGRLSVSSSRSSGTMSSSRGSLDNLIESNYSSRLENYPQVIGGATKYKQSSPSKPKAGIVNQKKNVFEQLSHKSSASNDIRGSREDLDKLSCPRRLPSDEASRERKSSIHCRENSRSPSHYSGHNSRRSSFSPPLASSITEKENSRLRKYSHDRDSFHSDQTPSNRVEALNSDNQSSRSTDISSRTTTSDFWYSEAKVVKTSYDQNRSSEQHNIPKPPLRSSSSIQAVRNYHPRSSSSNFQEENNHTSPQICSQSERSPSQGQSSTNHSLSPNYETSPSVTITRPLEKSTASSKSSGRQERMFGVMSDGKSRNVVAASVTVSPKVRSGGDKANANAETSRLTPVRYEHLKDSHSERESKNSSVDYVSRKTIQIEDRSSESSTPRHIEHHKSGSAESNVSSDSKSTGKYGSVWKTPQNHRRVRSHDFSTVLQDWETRKSNNSEQPKLSVYKGKNSENVALHQDQEQARDALNKNSADVQVDNLPSILRSLQNTQHGDRRYKNFEEKSSTDNYEKIWYSESSTKQTVDMTKQASSFSAKERQNGSSTSYKDWKSEFKEVDLDDTADDAFGHQDSYCNDIKDMSRKVLRVTSFTRKILEVSPSSQTFEQKKKQFQFPSERTASAVAHTRSRSYGNEIDEASEPLSARSASNDSSLSQSFKPRPKSAGVVRPGAGSNSYSSDASSSPTSPPKQGVDANKRTLIDVKPEVSTPTSGQQEGMKIEKRAAVLNFITRKTGRSFDGSGELGHYPSSTSIHTSHSDETDKRRWKEKDTSLVESRIAKLGSSDDLSAASSGKKRPVNERATPSSRKSDHTTSVRKLKNFKETRDKFLQGVSRLTSRTKSASSLLEEETTKSGSSTPSLVSADKSASMENLTDSGLDLSRASPTGHLDVIPTSKRDRSKSSPNIKPLYTHYGSPLNDSFAQAPPRRHTKNHRQRHSNSSSASSATTISTLSSFSSSSSTSMGRFPALGEEAEGLPSSSEASEYRQLPEENHASPPTSIQNEPDTKAAILANRVPIDTGTYKVAKRAKVRKSPSKPSIDETAEASLKPAEDTEARSLSPVNTSASIATIPSIPKPIAIPEVNKVSPEEQEKANRIIEKVKRSASFKETKLKFQATKTLPPPPSPPPQNEESERLLDQIVQRRLDNELPPTPSVPGKEFHSSNSVLASRISDSIVQEGSMVSLDPNKQSENDLHSLPATATSNSYENVHINGANRNYENVFTPPEMTSSNDNPLQTSSSNGLVSTPDTKKRLENSSKAEGGDGKTNTGEEETTIRSPPPEISPEPLLPDISLLTESSLQEQHPDLTRDIIKGDRALTQVLTTSNKKTLDYMAGVLPQPSHDIIEQGMRYRRRKPTNQSAKVLDSNTDDVADNHVSIQNGRNSRPVPTEGLLNIPVHPHLYLQQFRNDISCRDNLPASSTYYKTSASKAKILNLVKEKIAEGEFPMENQETLEDINQKKMELVLSIKEKLDDLQSMKGLLDVEMRENENLGKQVYNLTKKMCNQREQEKYNIFVQDVDKIINLLLSLSGRLARVENTIQMLPSDADKQEMELLREKQKKLTEQHNDAKQLKENIDRRQKAVSEILASYFNQEEFADYEHYIKMKSALIMEQRELDDKAKLGHEQMQCLRDSLPEEWQINLDNMLEE